MSQDILLSLIASDPEQPRKHFDQGKIVELAQSMVADGLIVPILVRPDGERFVIVHGERRYRAALSLGWQAIMADVRDVMPDEARWLSLIENVQRQDLSPIEEARAYQARLAEGITQTELGRRIGKSQSYIAQKLRLLGLSDPVGFYVDCGAITEGHARQLLKLRGIYEVEVMTELNEVNELVLSWDDTQALLNLMRPEDNPPCWFLSEEERPTITEACNKFWQYVIRSNYKLSQWGITAFWWASVAVYLDLSVANLSRAIDRWEERLLAAVGWLAVHKNDDPPKDKITGLHYWGHLADLQHAGVLDWAKDPPDGIHLKAVKQMVIENAWLAPSSCQPWGFQSEEYSKCLQRDFSWLSNDER